MLNHLKIIVFLWYILFSVHYIIGVSMCETNCDPIEKYIPKLKSNTFKLLKDPWLDPKDGILATRKIKIFTAAKDHDENLKYTEVKNILNHIVDNSGQLRLAAIKKARQHNRRGRRNYFREKRRSRSKESSSDHLKIVYPELAIVVTYDFFELFDFDYWLIIPYLLSFWNAVDMRYRGFENPKYRFYISQIIFEKKPGSFEFLETYPNNSDYIKSKSIYKAREFWYAQSKSIPLDSYDLMAIMTSRLICAKLDEEEKKCKAIIFGQAWPSGACNINHQTQQTQNMAIMYDNGAYEGITTAAHEIGHLLGANDDGISFFNHTTNNWGPALCKLEDGYIMSGGKQATRNSFYWSSCTLDKFQQFIHSDQAKCVYNKPKDYNNPIPRYLPGKLMNADDQCRRAGGIESCESEISNCVMLQCLFDDGECKNTSAPAVEGTTCGYNTIGQICIHGECVFETEIV